MNVKEWIVLYQFQIVHLHYVMPKKKEVPLIMNGTDLIFFKIFSLLIMLPMVQILRHMDQR